MSQEAGKRAETRKRVLRVAAAEMRSRGPSAVGVANVMQRAGLTHGGFYAHFPSKDALIAASLEQMFTQVEGRVRRVIAGKPSEDALGDYIDLYLSEAHRDRPEIGCPIAALSPELARQDPAIRQVLDRGLATLLSLIEPLLPTGNAAGRRALAASIIAEMAGAVALSRAVLDRATSTDILAAARQAVRARTGLAAGRHPIGDDHPSATLTPDPTASTRPIFGS